MCIRDRKVAVACNTISNMIENYQPDYDFKIFSIVQAGSDDAVRMDLQQIGVLSTCLLYTSRPIFGQLAMKVLYNECAYYADQFVEYVEENVKTFHEGLKNIKGMHLIYPEGTYLLWVCLLYTSRCV